MQYGSFDDHAREYVITHPNTPKSWINYLGSRLYGGIITQNAGGYSFYKSGAQGRLLRMRFNGVPVDQPGRYLYLRDNISKDYWSTSWQPVGKPLDVYQSTVRHGLGYSTFEALYSGIKSVHTCFIPKDKAFEYWGLAVTNTSAEVRHLSIYSYAELANEWSHRQDLENLQYSQYIIQMGYRDGVITRHSNNGMNDLYFTLCGAEVTGFDTDRDVFLGDYRTPHDPLVVDQGVCSNSIATGDNACLTLQTTLSLEPGETRNMLFLLGVGSYSVPLEGLPAGKQIIAEYGNWNRMEHELDVIRQEWMTYLSTLQVQTPDPNLNSMINVWNAYQTHVTFNWSRGVSLIEAGERDGLGYRDTVQDMLAVTHSIPDAVEQRLNLILTGQTSAGAGMPNIKHLTHQPGREAPPADHRFRSDDALWLPITVSNFVFETGNFAYLDHVLPYADQGTGTVYDHLKRALQFSLDHIGINGLTQGLSADWNDCINFGAQGESVFTSFMFYHACQLVAELAELKGEKADQVWCLAHAARISECIQACAWDGAWFLRGLAAEGSQLGSAKNAEGRIYLESQCWAVISGAAAPEQAIQCMDSVKEYLATDYGIVLCDPPHTEPDPYIGLPLVYPGGHKENGGIFCHSNAWAVVAEAILGRGDRAYAYYESYLPAYYNDKAQIRQVEPYVYAQFTHGKRSPRFGQSRNPWLTGTASWSYIAVTQYLLGLKPTAHGLKIDPCLPTGWDGFNVRRQYRGRWCNIIVHNPQRRSKGVQRLRVNGQDISGNIVPADLLIEGENQIEAVIETDQVH
ncbi:MAG: N,N'-diacetylchitobiose phosphorylase [Anaerolineae bacterium]|nr:N,N'-diacetylchitobiose phosphorylase [Anaerolineae bacterium]